MTNYEVELQQFRPDDEIQGLISDLNDRGYQFIPTASHGYLVVPLTDKYASNALLICDCGYIGRLAIYLEEDCEAPDFLKHVELNETANKE